MISQAKLKWISVWVTVLLGLVWDAAAQPAPERIVEIKIILEGDSEVTKQYVRDHIRLKVGDVFTRERTNEDVKNLMKSGRFADVQIFKQDPDEGEGVVLTYEVEGFPLLKSVSFNREIFEFDKDGEKIRRILSAGLRIKIKKLSEQIQLKKGQQYNDARRTADEIALREYYIKEGYFPAKVVGLYIKKDRAVTYTIREGERVKIEDMVLERVDGPELSFDVDELDNFVKARERRRWYNPISWLTNDGRLKPLELKEDIERLATYYRNRGFLDVKVSYRDNAEEVVLDNLEYQRLRRVFLNAAEKYRKTLGVLGSEEAKEAGPDEAKVDKLKDQLDDDEDAMDDAEDELDDFLDDNDLVKLTFQIHEGKRYHVGSVKFTYQKEFEDADGKRIVDIKAGDNFVPVIPPNTLLSFLAQRPGDVYRPEELEGKDDSDVKILKNAYGAKAHIKATVRVIKTANLENSTMDLEYKIFEDKIHYVDLVKIEGNDKTMDFVIRRELAIAPGEPFDLGRVEISERRIKGLRLFADVRAKPERDKDKNKDNLVVSVRETNTGRFTLTGGFSTDFGAFAGIMLAQENFDIGRWRRPHFWQGAGQKIRLRVVSGGRYNNYGLDFVEPWFLGRKLRLTTSLFSRESQYYSTKFDVEETGIRLGLERTLFGNDYFRGKLFYTIEDSGLVGVSSTASTQLKNEAGTDVISKLGGGLAYDTRGGGDLPTRGQRTSVSLEVAPDMLGSEKEFYGFNLKTAWYFKGLREGHVIELIGQAGVVDAMGNDTTVPYLYRKGLGGSRSLRGYDYREVGPRGDQGDYLGGNSMLAGTIEYSVPTPWEFLRVATFYDWGVVNTNSWDFDPGNYNDNWGIGLRIEIPFLGPLRMDYGIPINDDGFNGGNKFNLNFGYTTSF